MRYRDIIAFATLLASGACSKPPPYQDALATKSTAPVAFTVECVGESTDHICATKSKCTKDADSDCKMYANACIDGGHTYEGNRNGGTCTRAT